jgi:hypothetical protein
MALPVPHSVISIASINLFMSLSSREKCCIALLDADISRFGCKKMKINYFVCKNMAITAFQARLAAGIECLNEDWEQLLRAGCGKD